MGTNIAITIIMGGTMDFGIKREGQKKTISRDNWVRLVASVPTQNEAVRKLGLSKDWLRRQAELYDHGWPADHTPGDCRPDGSIDDAIRRKVDGVARQTNNKQLRQALDEIVRLRRAVETTEEVRAYKITPIRIAKKVPGGSTEACAIGLLSDVHFEQRIRPETIHRLNEYNPDIAQSRLENFFRGFVRLTEIERGGVKIPQAILYLLGDMIHGQIHDEYQKSNTMSPVEATYRLLNILSGGIRYVAKQFKLVTIICHVGNHGRTTDKIEIDSGIRYSYEWLLYSMLAREFRAEKNINFVIPESNIYYHTLYDMTLRSLHGNFVKYAGGVGGITIPLNKALAQWDKSIRADCTFMGHWHQFLSGKNHVCNSSVCGYDPYAESIKAEFDRPSQTFVLIDTKHGKQDTRPIFL